MHVPSERLQARLSNAVELRPARTQKLNDGSVVASDERGEQMLRAHRRTRPLLRQLARGGQHRLRDRVERRRQTGVGARCRYEAIRALPAKTAEVCSGIPEETNGI